jgi:hypothetical protein
VTALTVAATSGWGEVKHVKSTVVRVDIAALERLPVAAKAETVEQLAKCTWSCTVSCVNTCRVTQ